MAILEMDLFYYNLRTKCQFKWRMAKIANERIMAKLTPQEVRDSPHGDLILDAGKHCSFFGTPEEIRDKINSFSHTEYNTAQFTAIDHIKACIVSGTDLFLREGVQFDRLI